LLVEFLDAAFRVQRVLSESLPYQAGTACIGGGGQYLFFFH
jgi:hypothetical protein